MRAFSRGFLAALPAVDGFILKSRSPTCGVRDTKIYPAADAARPLRKGAGLFARAVLEKFGHLPVEDEARLARPAPRARFLTRLFTLASFRGLGASPGPGRLARFHAGHEALLRAHSPREEKNLAQIAAGAGAPEKLLARYEAHLRLALSRRPAAGRPFPPPYPVELMEMDEQASAP